MFLGQPTTSANYTVNVTVNTKQSSALAGVAAIGDDNNILYTGYQNGTVRLVQVKGGKAVEVASKKVAAGKSLKLRMQVKNGKEMRFWYSTSGNNFKPMTMNGVDGGYLPPWDRAVRAGLVAKGNNGTSGVFDSFEMVNQ
jgi:hypothetical protein